MPSCPSVATLARLASDPLDGPAVAEAADHIDECEVCQSRLERFRRNDAAAGQAAPGLPNEGAPPRIPGFEIGAELGRGAMAVVYLAWQPSLDRRVALKVVRSGPGAGSRDHIRWLREARAASRVRHPNVVPLYDVGEADGWLYLVLEYVPGGTLKDRLDAPYPPRDAAGLVAKIAAAVGAIHRSNLLHLDLKPSNILLDAAPEASPERVTPRVTDFSIASRWNDADGLSMTSLAGPLGTPSYMAPERVAAARKKIGPAADIHGIGAILYHLLTGRPPFVAATLIDILDQVRGQDPVPPRCLDPKVPRDLETICLKCLRKDPGRRYDSAEALAEDLRRFLDGRPIAARPVSTVERAWRWCRRRPVIAGLATTLASTLAAAFFGMFFLWRRAEVETSMTNQVLADVVDLTARSMSQLTAPTLEQRCATLRETRRRVLEVAARRPSDRAIRWQLARIDGAFGLALVVGGKDWKEAQVVLDEAIKVQEELIRADPSDLATRSALVGDLMKSAHVEESQRNAGRSVERLKRAVTIAEQMCQLRPGLEAINTLAEVRDRLAMLLFRHGDRARARALMEANRRALEVVSAGYDPPWFRARRIFAHIGLERFRDGPTPRSSVPPNVEPGGATSLLDLAPSEAELLPAERWAELALGALASKTRTETDPVTGSEAGYQLMELLWPMAAEQRRSGRLEQARRTADRMLELGQRLAIRYPDQPSAYLALGQAHMQFVKNAWRSDDRAAVERHLVQARDAAVRALILNPNDGRALTSLEKWQQKLDAVRHPQ